MQTEKENSRFSYIGTSVLILMLLEFVFTFIGSAMLYGQVVTSDKVSLIIVQSASAIAIVYTIHRIDKMSEQTILLEGSSKERLSVGGIAGICVVTLGLSSLVNGIVNLLLIAVFGTQSPAFTPLQNLDVTKIGLVAVLCGVIIGPIFEELLFRKAIIDHIRVYGAHIAILLSALLFALFHMNLSQFPGAFIFGLFAGYLYWRTNNVGYTIGLHILNNFIAVVVVPWFDAHCGVTMNAMGFDPRALFEHGGTVAIAYAVVQIVLIAIMALAVVLTFMNRKTIASILRVQPGEMTLKTALSGGSMLALVIICAIVTCLSVF